MTVEDLAREAGMHCDDGRWFSDTGDPRDAQDVSTEALTRFSALVRRQALEDAVEACIAVGQGHGSAFAEFECPAAIRALADKP